MSPWKADPLGVPRNPLAVYLLALSLLTGLSVAVGPTTVPSVAALLPSLAERGWGVLLAWGATSTLLGMYWQGSPVTGLLMKKVGMFVMAVTVGLLALLVVANYGWDGLLGAGTYLGFSLACALQYHALDQRVKVIIRTTQEESR